MRWWEWLKGCRPVTRRRHAAELAVREAAFRAAAAKALAAHAQSMGVLQDQATFLELALISLARGRGGRIWLKRSTMERTPEGLSLKVTNEGGDLVFEVLPSRKVVPIEEGRADGEPERSPGAPH